ncbi:MAG: DUF896 domain-containing protein [Lachnospiraceae bacterium]|nr:DUF896 domain-containing protein [Lachnospiraceae bacterium]
MEKSRIDRINELYHKSQKTGLTPEEKEEQARLRREYIEAIRRNMRGTLEQISLLNPDGSVTDLSELHAKKYPEGDGGRKNDGKK